VGAEPDAVAPAIAGADTYWVIVAPAEVRAASASVSSALLLAADPALVEPAVPVLAMRDPIPTAIELAEFVVAAGDSVLAGSSSEVFELASDVISLVSDAPAAHASTVDAPTAIEPAAGGTSRSTPATAARFSSSPTLE
jgi:hypothetical protein